MRLRIARWASPVLARGLLFAATARTTAQGIPATTPFLDRPAHIRVYNVPLLDALRVLLSSTAFSFREIDGQLMPVPVAQDIAARAAQPTRDTIALPRRPGAESLPIGETRALAPDSAIIIGTVWGASHHSSAATISTSSPVSRSPRRACLAC